MNDDDGFDHMDLWQVKKQDETRAELAKLNEFNRQQAYKEAGMCKCPWCAAPIEDKVIKCRYCTSSIEWVDITDLEPCKPEDKELLIRMQKKEKLEEQKIKREQQAIDNQLLSCEKCKKIIKRGDAHEIERHEQQPSLMCEACAEKQKKSDELWDCIGSIVAFLIILSVLAGVIKFLLSIDWNTHYAYALWVFPLVLGLFIYLFFFMDCRDD